MLSVSTSSFCRRHTHFEILESLRDSAKQAAAGFIDEGMKAFYNLWSINIFNEGSEIKDENKLQDFTHRVVDYIAASRRQAKIEKMYGSNLDLSSS